MIQLPVRRSKPFILLLCSIRRFASTETNSKRPELLEIFPKKKFVNKELFEMDSRMSYRKLWPIYEQVYSNLDKDDEVELPRYINGSDLLIMKKMLEKYRNFSGIINKNLLVLENELIELSAEYGNNDAISILAFSTLGDVESEANEREYASKLIQELYEVKNTMCVKLLGDLAYKHEDHELSLKYYMEFLELENDTVLASEVYKMVGILNFNNFRNLSFAKQYFLNSIKYGTLDKTLECHYYLGIIFQLTDPNLSKFHLQLAASKSFREAFKSLGHMELNYFHNYELAKEWFKLGIEIKDYDCLFGLFDTFYELKDFENAKKSLQTIEKVFKKNNELVTQFLNSRNEKIVVLMNAEQNEKLATVAASGKTSIYQ